MDKNSLLNTNNIKEIKVVINTGGQRPMLPSYLQYLGNQEEVMRDTRGQGQFACSSSSFSSSKLGKLSTGWRAPWLLIVFRKTSKGHERQRRSRSIYQFSLLSLESCLRVGKLPSYINI